MTFFYLINYNISIVQVRYITIETKEAAHIGYNRFLFPHSYSGDGLGAVSYACIIDHVCLYLTIVCILL